MIKLKQKVYGILFERNDNMKFYEKDKIIELLKREIVPALGCTEPIAVALASAKAKEILNAFPDTIEILVSGNILKNGMGVGIPGTDMTGLSIAAALGVIGGRSEEGLEVLKYISEKDIKLAKEFVKSEKVSVSLKSKCEKLYIECICRKDDEYSKVIIRREHSNIEYIEHNGDIVYNNTEKLDNLIQKKDNEVELSIEKIYDFATSVDVSEVKFILEGMRLNKAIAEEGLSKEYGLQVGKKIIENIHKGILSNDIMTHAMALTAAASDARMAGCMMPVMSNSGSGNQGITVMLPVVAVGERLNVSEEKLIRALVISNLVAIHIKHHLGKLSALCGCVIAAGGASSGITYILGGDVQNISYAIKNMVGNISGMICDGAKIGCALKVSTGASAAVQSALLAIDGIEVSHMEGIIDRDIENTIINLANIGVEGMGETDKLILDIMLNKS